MSRYRVSVVMAVYNVAPFLNEAVDSLINQTIGFENIQLILVDDGSQDDSPRICDDYASNYPNILALHKENSGVASARNIGLEYADGDFINFMDSDDVLTESTMEDIVNFFEANGEYTDVVCIPLFFFDGQSGPHGLNYKFDRGARVIDLNKEPSTIQLSMSSAFIKREALEGAHFNEKLHFGEDANVLLRILARKSSLGVLRSSRYMYRKRTAGEMSAIQKSESIPEWYMDYLVNHQLATIHYFQETLGYIPLFIQHALAYDLQWRIRQQEIPENLFSPEEIQAYKDTLVECLNSIDNTVIKAQKSLWHEHRLWAVSKKSDSRMEIVDTLNERYLKFENLNLYFYTNCQLAVEFIELNPDSITIEGYTVASPLGYSTYSVMAKMGDEFYESQPLYRDEPHTALGEPIMAYHGFKFTIPLSGDLYERIDFFTCLDGHLVECRNVVFKKYSPISKVVPGAYYYKNNWIIEPENLGIRVRRAGRMGTLKAEVNFLKGLWRKNGLGMRKAIVLRSLAHLLKLFKHKEIWLISDKANRADDNGEAFFTYLQKHADPSIKPYFLIGKDTADFSRLQKVGKVIPYMSWSHKLKYLIADYSVSAYSHDEINNPFIGYHDSYRDLLQGCKYVFLQHGVIKDDLSRGLNRWHKNMVGFVTSARREYESVVKTPSYGYGEDQVWLTGLPRYDRLYQDEKNEIVIMPTWRRELVGAYHADTSAWDLKPGFQESDYLVFYKTLLSHPRLLAEAERLGYTVNFVPHPVFFPYVDQFDIPGQVKLWGTEVCYRDMFAHNRLLLTDYSSVAFDFAYLRKPVLYAHFDTNHYEEGYFDYETDGFGEVCHSVEETVDQIVNYMQNGCKLKDGYRNRIDEFFAFGDKENSKRVYDQIRKLK